MSPIARCQCSGTQCACAITAGDASIEIVGSGAKNDPYEITAAVNSISNALTVNNVGHNVQLLLLGDGTQTNPATLSGDTAIAMSDLTDVNDPAGPAVGDVPVWVGDHWEFQPQSTAPVGAIATSNGISGDGSIGSPVVARTSGTWPLANYPATQVATSGEEIYLDGAGVLRSAPDTIAPAKPVTDLATTYPPGLTSMQVTGPEGVGWPTGTTSVVTTSRRSDGAATQWCALNSSADTKVWIRSGNSSGWSPWVQIAGAALPGPVDTYNAADQNITATTRGTETPSHVRASVANPSTMRRMLVRCVQTCWVLLESGASGAVYFDTMLISGGSNAIPPFDWRFDNITGGSNPLYASTRAEATLWVPASTTLVMGVGAARSNTGLTTTIRYVHNSLTPLRFE